MTGPADVVMIDYRRPLAERAKARKVCGPYRWRPTAPGQGRGFYQASGALACDARGSTFDLRLELANDHLRHSRLARIEGYFCDSPVECSETLAPIIARLPRGRGFLAGWTMGAGMCGSLSGDIWADEHDAALAAHDMAERDAERSREEQERDSLLEADSEGADQ